ENVRTSLPCASKIAARSRLFAQVVSHASRMGSFNVVFTCEFALSRLGSALLFEHEGGHSSRLSRDRYGLRVRRGLSHSLDRTRNCRSLPFRQSQSCRGNHAGTRERKGVAGEME